MIQSVIFDLDGTLLDTEKYYFAKWKEAMVRDVKRGSLHRVYADDYHTAWIPGELPCNHDIRYAS